MSNEDEESQPYDDADDSHDDASEGGSSKKKKKKKKSKPAGCREIILRWGAVGNFCLQGVNVVLQLSPAWGTLADAGKAGRGLVYSSSGIGALHSPVIIYKERQLTNEDTFRNALNGIREEQGRLADQNDILSGEIDELESEVDRMKDVEQALRLLADTQGSQLNELMELIAENKEINEGLRAVLKQKVLEEVISLVLDIDNDGSFTIEDKEIDRLVIGMNLIEVMTFNEQVFRKQVLSCEGNVDEVIELVKAMIRGTDSGEGGEKNTIDLDCDPQEYFDKKRGNG